MSESKKKEAAPATEEKVDESHTPSRDLLPSLIDDIKKALDPTAMVKGLPPLERVALCRGLVGELVKDAKVIARDQDKTGFPSENVVGKLLVNAARIHGMARVFELFRTPSKPKKNETSNETHLPPRRARGRGGRKRGDD